MSDFVNMIVRRVAMTQFLGCKFTFLEVCQERYP